MVAKKDVNMSKHPKLADKNAPNLHVIKVSQVTRLLRSSLPGDNFYWYLTNKGTWYLHDFQHLPPEIVPATLCHRPEGQLKGLEASILQDSPNGSQQRHLLANCWINSQIPG
ncbi:40S ribosomal protein S10 [Myotis brandtii]|uniref:40S ribosomal protein S10 n=1 Tax=Myotis brandtii TaxID=109478 RepID=S7NK88_MYOBR|nr:40S ribosomal protein S10 [Myotis brandtii]